MQKQNIPKCSVETAKRNANYPNTAVKGLDSDFITESIIASQRFQTRLIKKYDVVSQLKTLNVGAIFNLQLPGENSQCAVMEGDFAYDPQIFIDEGFQYFNIGWEDLTAPPINLIDDQILPIMHTIIQEQGKKILVHCHAGTGRTGVVICCYLIKYCGKKKNVVDFIRSKRPRCLNRNQQRTFKEVFRKRMKDLLDYFQGKDQAIESVFQNQDGNQMEYFALVDFMQAIEDEKEVSQEFQKISIILKQMTSKYPEQVEVEVFKSEIFKIRNQFIRSQS